MKKLIISIMLVVLCVFASACSTSKIPDKQTATTTSTTKAQTTTQTTTTTTQPLTTELSFYYATELKELHNYSSAREYLANVSEQEKISLISKDLKIDELNGNVKNFTPSQEFILVAEGAVPQPENEYGYYAKVQLTKDAYNNLTKKFEKRTVNVNQKALGSKTSWWWDVSSDDIKYSLQVSRITKNLKGSPIRFWNWGYLVEKDAKYYLYVCVRHSFACDYYVKENKETTTTKSYDKLTELKEINNYSTAKDYLTNASDKDKLRLIAKELEIENLKGVIKNFTPVAYDDGDDKTPQPNNEYGYYARIQLSKEVYKTLAKDFNVDYPNNINKQFIQESASWWDISKGDVRYYCDIPRGALTSSGAIILTVWSNGFLVDNNTEYYLYVDVSYSCVSDYYIRENKN